MALLLEVLISPRPPWPLLPCPCNSPASFTATGPAASVHRQICRRAFQSKRSVLPDLQEGAPKQAKAASAAAGSDRGRGRGGPPSQDVPRSGKQRSQSRSHSQRQHQQAPPADGTSHSNGASRPHPLPEDLGGGAASQAAHPAAASSSEGPQGSAAGSRRSQEAEIDSSPWTMAKEPERQASQEDSWEQQKARRPKGPKQDAHPPQVRAAALATKEVLPALRPAVWSAQHDLYAVYVCAREAPVFALVQPIVQAPPDPLRLVSWHSVSQICVGIGCNTHMPCCLDGTEPLCS